MFIEFKIIENITPESAYNADEKTVLMSFS